MLKVGNQSGLKMYLTLILIIKYIEHLDSHNNKCNFVIHRILLSLDNPVMGNVNNNTVRKIL